MASKERRAQDKARQTAAYYRAGEAVSDELAEAYLRAYKSLQAEAERVFRTFSDVFGLSEAQARRLLNDYPNASARELLRLAAEAMTDGPEKTRALAEISAPAYQYRINRLETLQDHVERRLKEVARQEVKLAKAHYTRVIEDSYLYGVYDVQRAAGVGFHFHDLSDRAVSAMVNARWPKLGITYSEAVWKDTAAIAQRIREDVLAGAMTGLPACRAMERIEEDFRVRAYEARRLVRTETARMSAEADKASMEACGIEEYEFCATLDEATCIRCGALDGKRFPAKQGEPGVNMEPLHPNCGCYTVPVVEEFGGRAGTRLARDPETGENVKIPEDMTFEAWKSGLQNDGEDGKIYAAGRHSLQKTQEYEKPDVHYIGKLDKGIYSCVTDDIATDEVIITDERIRHIKERHPGDYERFVRYIPQIIAEPDYIMEANKPDTAFVLKRFDDDNEHFELIIRLQTSKDISGHKNSVITYLKVQPKRYQRYLRTKTILYRRE